MREWSALEWVCKAKSSRQLSDQECKREAQGFRVWSDQECECKARSPREQSERECKCNALSLREPSNQNCECKAGSPREQSDQECEWEAQSLRECNDQDCKCEARSPREQMDRECECKSRSLRDQSDREWGFWLCYLRIWRLLIFLIARQVQIWRKLVILIILNLKYTCRALPSCFILYLFLSSVTNVEVFAFSKCFLCSIFSTSNKHPYYLEIRDLGLTNKVRLTWTLSLKVPIPK